MSNLDLINSDIDLEPFGTGFKFLINCQSCLGTGDKIYQNDMDDDYSDICRCCGGSGDYYLYCDQDGNLKTKDELL